MTIDELNEQSNKDLTINKDELGLESLRTTDIFHKYNRLRGLEKIRLNRFIKDFKSLFLKRWEFYSGKAEDSEYNKEQFFQKVLKSDRDIYLDGDIVLSNAKDKVDYQQEIVDSLDRILKRINDRTWCIRNAIDFLKHTNFSGD